MKSFGESYLAVVHGILEDAAYRYPTFRTGFARDFNRIEFLVRSRGAYQLALVDLPNVGKHLDRCLDCGLYSRSNLPTTSGVRSGQIPDLFRGLYLQVFDKEGLMLEEPDAEAVFFLRQLLLLAKKSVVQCPLEHVHKEVREFLRKDWQMPYWDPTTESWVSITAQGRTRHSDAPVNWEHAGWMHDAWSGDLAPGDNSLDDESEFNRFCWRDEVFTGRFARRLERVSGFIIRQLGRYNPADWRSQHGPGAVSNRTRTQSKYEWTNWSDRLEREFPISEHGYYNLCSWAGDALSETMAEEPSSKLVAVPKTYSKPRLIAAESSEMMWCQKNIQHYLYSRIENSVLGYSIPLRDQSVNQDAALRASATGQSVTVDLSAASDCVSVPHVLALFRREPRLCRALMATRTHFLNYRNVLDEGFKDELPRGASITCDGPLWSLRKFATMGNSCTFPVESLIFLAICLASLSVAEDIFPTDDWCGRKCSAQEVLVFGDDIVISRHGWEVLRFALPALGFAVNANKTYFGKNFRESCGKDCFRGTDVSPAYWKYHEEPTSAALVSQVDQHNNFHAKWLLNAAAVIRSTLPRDFPVVEQGSGAVGINTRQRSYVRYELVRNGIRCRWSSKLQRNEVRVPHFKVRDKKTSHGNDQGLLQYFTEALSPVNSWREGFLDRRYVQKTYRWIGFEQLLTK